MTDLQELMACPFCGSPGKSDNGFMPCESITYAFCSNSGCKLHDVDIGFTPETWNRRSPAFAEKDRERLDWLEGGIDRVIYKTALKDEWCAQEVGIAACYGGTPREEIDAAIDAVASGGGCNHTWPGKRVGDVCRDCRLAASGGGL